MKYEVKTNANATEGRTFKATINGEVKTITDIRYAVSTPVFDSLQEFCTEAGGMPEGAQAGLLSLITTAIANAYMNKAVEHIARDLPVEVWSISDFFQLTGNREGISKALEMCEEAIQELTLQRMEALAAVNGILTDVISGKIKPENLAVVQAELTAKVAEIDGRIAEQTERLAKLQVVKEEQAVKNKERGLKAAAARKANAA